MEDQAKKKKGKTNKVIILLKFFFTIFKPIVPAINEKTTNSVSTGLQSNSESINQNNNNNNERK